MPSTFDVARPLPALFLVSLTACAAGSADGGAFPAVADGSGVPVPAPSSTPGAATPQAPPTSGASEDVGNGADDASPAEQDEGGETDSLEADASGDDGGASEGQAGAEGAAAMAGAVAPALGDLLVTEVMFDPSGVQPGAQWFEIHNLAQSPKLLSGLTIEDQNGIVAVIASDPPVVVPAGSYAVIVRDRAQALAGFIPAGSIVFEYGSGQSADAGIQLASDVTGELSLWQGSLELDDVPYGLWGMDSPGHSVELGPQQLVGADQPWNWCLASNPWATASDEGTPGQANDCP
jgi:hypothetical protein